MVSDSEIKEILENHKNVAVVGLSHEKSKYSYIVAEYLKGKGYRIIPVNPFDDKILGEKCYKSLLEMPKELQKQVEIMDIFRPSDKVMSVVDETIQIKKKYGTLNLDSKMLKLNIKNLGVIVNTAAGAGGAFIENAASSAISKFRDSHIIRPHLWARREATIAAASELAPSVDAILVVGGDGTMSDVAYSLFKAGATTPILGVGAGSANAGPLITVRLQELDRLDPSMFIVREVGGMLAFLNGEQVGLGFNDVVLGDTVLTTVEGRVVQVSAVEFLKGRKIPVPPSRVGTADSEVRIERGGESPADIVIHRGVFGQLFASPLEKRYLGKGLAGGTSLAAALGLPAGIAITSEPLVNFNIGIEELLLMEPIVTKTASIREVDNVVVRGIREGTCLNVDGNPLALFGHGDEVQMRYIPAAARAVRLVKHD